MKKPLALDFLVGAQVKAVSTNRYLSAALLKNTIQVWGERQENIKIQAKSIACGGNFVVIGLENEVLVWGSASYDLSVHSNQVTSIGNVFPVAISAGLAHGLVLDTEGLVYCFGLGEKGELGLGPSTVNLSCLQRIDLQAVCTVMCHGQISVAMGRTTVYVWGLINPEGLESAVGKG